MDQAYTAQYVRLALDNALNNNRVQLRPWVAQAIADELHVTLAHIYYGKEKDREGDGGEEG